MPRPIRQFNSFPFSQFEELTLEIESLANQGAGVARVEIQTAEGETRRWVVFVPFSIPGERIRCRILRNDKNCSHAEIIEILEPSPQRVSPKCPLFTDCGGCQYQHMDYELQLEWKTRQTQELLARLAGIKHEVNPCIPSPSQWAYRSKITPHLASGHSSKQSRQKPETASRIGFLSGGFLSGGFQRQVVDVPHCPIAKDEVNTTLTKLRKTLLSQKQHQVHKQPTRHTRTRHSRRPSKEESLLIRTGVNGTQTDPSALLQERVRDVQFAFRAGDFFQTNPSILPEFVQYVGELAKGSDIPYLVDAYCGSGLFALTLAQYFQSVHGVEIVESAVQWARQNAKTNGIEHAKFSLGSAESIFSKVSFPPDQTSVVIDPPRKGSDEAFLHQLCAFQPKKIVYISCHPATQMRDLRYLIKEGYALRVVQPFDLFPQTKHLECVMLLEKNVPESL